jgi:hypothetical protein
MPTLSPLYFSFCYALFLYLICDKLIETGRCCGMEMNVEKTKTMRISRQSPSVTIMIGQKELQNV